MSTAVAITATPATPRLLWLDLTRKCQLNCTHCYNASGPKGTHGAMSREDWTSVLDQAAKMGVGHVQFIGGEPTLHPDFEALTSHALSLDLKTEVYSNLVHVSASRWELFQHDGLSLATSYYSANAREHNAMTGRRSHSRTRANIEKAVRLGIPLRAGIVAATDQQITEARRDLETLGVKRIGADRIRPFGRAGNDQEPQTANLCGRCGSGAAAINPDGTVSPCVFSTWIKTGSVRDSALTAILGGAAMTRANTSIRESARMDACRPACDPNAECTPGFPGTECDPKN
ncbi:radical SAM protein [Streptomyces sp. NPDC057654]|uniref:radical SAM protein n=1 Tax=Streptomyces sp. NPDC057654 TaxID=3346196 RepID=UPI0036AF75E1